MPAVNVKLFVLKEKSLPLIAVEPGETEILTVTLLAGAPLMAMVTGMSVYPNEHAVPVACSGASVFDVVKYVNGNTVLVSVVVNNPRPCVTASIVLSDALRFSISILVLASPWLVGDQSVDVPFNCEVVQTPISVASKAWV